MFENPRSQDFRIVPIKDYAGVDRSSWDAKFFRPFSGDLRFAIQCQQVIRPHVPLLFFFRGPAAVTLFVVSLVVNAINRVSRTRPFAHVGQKCGKVISPPTAYFDTACAVPFVIAALRVVAALLHVPPNSVFLGFGNGSRIACSHDESFRSQRRLWSGPIGRPTAPLARFIIPPIAFA